jgi:hypothetical protein
MCFNNIALKNMSFHDLEPRGWRGHWIIEIPQTSGAFSSLG